MYTVRIIGSGKLGDVIFTSTDEGEAKAFAEAHGNHYYYGTCVVDTETGMADCGDRIIPVSEMFREAL